MKYQIIIIFLSATLVLPLIGCTGKENKGNEIIDNQKDYKVEIPVNIKLPPKGAKILNVSEFADTILFIPLETNAESLLGGVQRVQITGNKILIAGNDRLILFSKDGNFLRQIGKKGNGPGEYNYITDFAVMDDTITISPSSKKTIVKYTLNGDFIGETLLPNDFRLSWFDVTFDKKFVSYKLLRSGKLCVLDKNLSKIDTITINNNAPDNPPPTIYRERFDYALENGSEKRLLFTDYMSDTIWDLSKGKKEIGYILNMGDKILPEEYRFERFGFDHERWMKVAAPYQKIKIVDTPSFLFLFQKGWVEEDILNTIFIYDKVKNMIKKYETPYIFDDLVSKQNLNPLYSSRNCIIATISPLALKQKLKKKSWETAPLSKWLDQMGKVKEDDNQILVIMPVRDKSLKKIE